MRAKPNVLVLKTDGTNCDEELAFAFKLAGGNAKIVHVNELRAKKETLKNYQILAIPGGFSYGDDVASGKILAIELTSFFSEELTRFVEHRNTATIGICNGFQVLVRTGLLPFGRVGTMQATLTNNDSGHFECRWVNLKIESSSRCVFLNNNSSSKRNGFNLSSRAKRGDLNRHAGQIQNLEIASVIPRNDCILSFQVAHGEGKFFAPNAVLETIEKQHLVAFRYVDDKGKPTQEYPQNPNGALRAIAGITDPTGRILGLMPHPERFVLREHHPNWRRMEIRKPQGLPIFKNMISFVQNA